MRKLTFLIFVLFLSKEGLNGKKVPKKKHAKHHAKHEYKKQFVVGMLPSPVAFAPQMIPHPDGLTPVIASEPHYLPLREDTPQFLAPQAAINPAEQPFRTVNEESLQYNPEGGALQGVPSAGPGPGENTASFLRPGAVRTSDGMARDGAIYLTGQNGASSSTFLRPNPNVYRINQIHSGARMRMDPNLANTRVFSEEPNSVLGTGMNTDTLKAITDTADLDESLKAFNSPVNMHSTNAPHTVSSTENASKLNEANIASQQVKLIEAENNKALDAVKEAEYKNTVKNAEMAANLAETAKTLQTLIKTLHAQKKTSFRTHSRHKGVPSSPAELNGGWSEWARWSDCSKSCGAGIKFARRSCNRPRPQDGGEPCRGRRVKVVLCNVDVKCPALVKPKDEILLRSL